MNIVNVSRVKQNVEGFTNVYIGRSNQYVNPLRNPFPMANESDRDRVCDEFEAYFHKHVIIPNDPIRNEVIRLYKMLKSGKKINLQCFCAPKRCHGNTIRAFLLKYFNLSDVITDKQYL